MKKIYLAGPDVFAPNNIQIGENNKKICEENGFIGFYPLDIEIKRTSLDVKYDIVKADILAIEQSDYVIANLSNFRGTMLHPSCDSGTAWECGYGLAKGKRVLGYTTNLRSIPDIMLNQLDLITIGDLNDIIQIAKNKFFNLNHDMSVFLEKETKFSIDPEYSDINDSSAKSAFILGYRYGKGLSCNAIITDARSEKDKFGIIDKNGYKTDDFNQCVNIMIECTCNIQERGRDGRNSFCDTQQR